MKFYSFQIVIEKELEDEGYCAFDDLYRASMT